MSGLVGVYYTDGKPVRPSDVTRMVDSLAHRGPDGAATWCDGAVGLGHRMLWTTPESLHENLPLMSPTGAVVITADARIDNREELLPLLQGHGLPPEKITDSRLILAAYEAWGDCCTERLLGDFAFAIWDAREQRLFCARDPMGAKSLFYHQALHLTAVASEIKALLSLPEVPRRLNEVRVGDCLAQIFDDPAITFYKDIYRLPAGHNLSVGRAGLRCWSYWSFDALRDVRLGSDEAYAEAFRALFTEAVRCRLRSAFPVGSALSGGLDSSSIACTARNILAEEGRPRLHTFSAIFPSLPEEDLKHIDERHYIHAVLATGHVEPHVVHADRISPLHELDRVLGHMDEAFVAPNLYIHWALYEAAHQQGVRVFLDGIDGDAVVSHGLGYLADLTRTGRWRTLAAEARALSAKHKAAITPRQVAWRFGIRPLIPEPVMQAWRIVRRRSQPRWAAGTVINPAFSRRVGLAERYRILQHKAAPVSGERGDHWLSLTSPLYPYALDMADKIAQAFSLEPRYPFFDRRLMAFCLALPPDQKLRQGWDRIVMRRAMDGILPHEVQWRTTKANLSPNFRRRLLDYDRALVEEVLKDERILERYVDVPALRAAYDRYKRRPMQSGQDALAVLGATVLARWLRQTGLHP